MALSLRAAWAMLWVQEVWTRVGENITGAQPLLTAGERMENNCVCCDSGGEPRSGIPHAGRCAGSGPATDTRKVSAGAVGQMWGQEERRRAPKSPRAHKKMASSCHIRVYGDTRLSDVCPLHLSTGSWSNKLVSYQLLRAVDFLML